MTEWMNCEGSDCNEKYKMHASNTEVFIFERAIDYSYVWSVCPECDFRHLVFIDADQLAVITSHRWPTNRQKFPPKNIRELWLEMNQHNLVRTYELSPRQERLITELEEALRDTPDDLLQDMFSTPPPKSDLPILWA